MTITKENQWMLEFEPGSVIEWCDKKFMVIQNNGTKGVVREIYEDGKWGDLVPKFYWNKNGIKSKLSS